MAARANKLDRGVRNSTGRHTTGMCTFPVNIQFAETASLFGAFRDATAKRDCQRHHVCPSIRLSAGNWAICGRIFLAFCIGNIYQNFSVHPTLINPYNPELNSICYLLALLGAHHFLHVTGIRVKSLTFRLLMYIYGAPILDVSRSHRTT